MECGDCTLCCDLFPVNWLNKPAREKCMHCDGGCLIHDAKPEECSAYNCAYAQSKTGDPKYRPDNCHMIFEMISDKIFYGVQDPDHEPTQEAHLQLKAFIDQGYSVAVAGPTQRLKFFFGPDHDSIEIEKEFMAHLKERYGND
jgi:hypothetical protein